MVDPVVAEDGNTYERAAILKWLASKGTSPLDPSCPLDASRLMTNRAVKQQIEDLVNSGDLDEELTQAYKARRWEASPDYARKLFKDGKVEVAAELGLPEAQGEMAERCYYGKDGEAKDVVRSVEWAKKAAAGGDMQGQFRLGHAYCDGEGGLPRNWKAAAELRVKAAKQGSVLAMLFCADLHKRGGRGVSVASPRYCRVPFNFCPLLLLSFS